MKHVRYKVASTKTRKRKKPRPIPYAVLVSGVLKPMTPGRKQFQLTMKNGEAINVRVNESPAAIARIRELKEQHITIMGILHLTALGKPNFLEAQTITAWQKGDEVFERLKVRPSTTQLVAQFQNALSGPNIAAEIWGKWPGEESIEQLLDMLKSSETAS